VRPDRLALRPRRAFAPRQLEVPAELGVGDGIRIDVRDARHHFTAIGATVELNRAGFCGGSNP
jgi:hypothetical protein